MTLARRALTPVEPVTPQRIPGPEYKPGDRTIPCTCTRHGATGFTNLRVARRGPVLLLDPHVDGSCVLALDQEAATRLRNEIDAWLRLTRPR